MPFNEAEMTINGEHLTMGQSMAVRVAIAFFIAHLNEARGTPDEDKIDEAYIARLNEVYRYIRGT